jgi:hypothetical protein
VATDPRQMKPSQLCRLLNSTPLGEVINERQLYRHRSRAGLRIGDSKHVDLLRYIAWLVQVRHVPQPEQEVDPYERLKERARARNVALALAGRDIGELPRVVDPARRQQATTNFRDFCEAYFPQTFHLPWSQDHLKVVRKIEQAVLHGGLFAMAMPRGSGKALALDTPLVTPLGWTTMGDVQVGDLLFDDEGWPCRVTFATEVQVGRPCYRVSFSDGEQIVCDAAHLWAGRRPNGNYVTLPTITLCRESLGSVRFSGIPSVFNPTDWRERTIVAIDPVPSVPVRCIQVDSPSHLYLAGRKMVPTHNTTLAECACLWAMLNGHREFVALIGSDEGHASDMLESIKMELDGNDLLLADFPEVVFPIQRLDGIANRCNGQLYAGERTYIGWTAKEIVLPTVRPQGWPDHPHLKSFVRDTGRSLASGAVIKVAGITGRIRGMKFKRADGRAVRPSLVVLDDPQTDESARSLSQCAHRESILAGAVLGMAGPGKKISGIMPCTVIRPQDMADNILNRDLHPEWNGERTKLVYSFPVNESLWAKYAQIRAEGLRAEDEGRAATEFYRQHQAAMDVGANVAWPERFNHDEVSAIQHAMNLRLQDEAAFYAEYQNEPLPESTPDTDELTAEQIANKLNRFPRSVIPQSAVQLAAFIDVQATLLFYMVVAWEQDFTGYVIDYGSFPDQRRPYFTLRDARQTLTSVAEGSGPEGAIYAGLERLTHALLGREWSLDGRGTIRVGKCLIDANWGASTDLIYAFCRQAVYAGTVVPSHGRFVGASSQPFSEYKRRPGDRLGFNWRVPNIHGKRAVRHVVFDANFWKSFVQARLAVTAGDRGCLSLFGDRSETHRLLAEHLTAEYRVKTEARGRVVDEWKQRPERPDNHWFDCLVGCAVAGSMLGVELLGLGERPRGRERVSFAQWQQRRRS